MAVISEDNKYKCYIIYVESFQSWPGPLSSLILSPVFTLSLSSSSPGQDSESGPVGWKPWISFVELLAWGKSDEGWGRRG